jgi:hypothetical protein
MYRIAVIRDASNCPARRGRQKGTACENDTVAGHSRRRGIASGPDTELNHRESRMLKGRILKPALTAVIAIASAIALTSLGATAASAATHQARPSSTSSDPTDHYIYSAYDFGFGVPPATGDPFAPVLNLAAYAAVSEGSGYYEWQADNSAGVLECITADVDDLYVTAQPCGRYPASQEWNYNNYGGDDTLYNEYASAYYGESICISPTQPYMTLAVCGSPVTNDWQTPDT